MYSFPVLEPVCCSMSSSNCCFLTCIQISEEAGQVVWYSNLFKTFPQFVVIHKVKGFQFSPSVMSDSLRPHGLQTPGFPVHHQLLKLAQTHVHLVGDAIQPFHPLSSPSPLAFNLSQHQGPFPLSHFFPSDRILELPSASASVLSMHIQD